MSSFYWRWRSDGKFRRKLKNHVADEGKYSSVGGGIVSTVDDLAQFLRLHLNNGVIDGKRFLTTEQIQEMRRREAPRDSYGLGFTLLPSDEEGFATRLFHTGSSGTMFWVDLNQNQIGVLITQHRISEGKDIPEDQKVLPKKMLSWQKRTKKEKIDPIFGQKAAVGDVVR